MALDDARKTLTDTYARHIDLLPNLEQVSTDRITRVEAGELMSKHPSATPAAFLAAGQAYRVSRDPQRTSPSATVRALRLPAIGQRGEKATAPRIAPTAIPLIGVSCFGHEGLPDGLPPSEP